MAKTRVFISFDYDHDADLKDSTRRTGQEPGLAIRDRRLVGQGGAFRNDWKEKVRSRIRRVDQVAVICGQYTDIASGVSAEVTIARDEQKPYFLLAGRASGGNKRPKSALSSDTVYKWTWDNLKALIAGRR